MNPKVRGAAIVNQYGSLITDDGKPIFTLLPKHLRKVDQGLLRFYADRKNTIYYIGSNALEELQGSRFFFDVLMCSPIIHSTQHDCSYLDRTGASKIETHYPFSTKSHNMAKFKDFVKTQAKYDSCDIMVLGGRSVYETFSGEYDEFLLTVFHSEQKGSKQLDYRAMLPLFDKRKKTILQTGTFEIFYYKKQTTNHAGSF